ncbi:MAG: 50S ribosome-binding GTPase [Acidobacteria bacterium]|nr:50S ribosome-binding GTPase [Acidobacteriota bacterium]MCL5288474.1 50S ribosome-binding GTPase [Acidobacteriota bacterium]
MPANLTPDYLAAERAYKEATSLPEKIAALEHMLAVIPKHKGTDRLQGDLKRKLAKLREEKEHAKHAGPARGAPVYHVEKEGAGQVALAGAPNTGKSSLLRALSHATPEVGDYPFTTRVPTPGMMRFEDIQIQLVDLPPLDPQYGETWVPQAVRAADAALIVVDLGAVELLDEIEISVAMLEKAKIKLTAQGADALVCPYGYVAKPVLVVANKVNLPKAREDFAAFTEMYAGRFPALAVSAETGEGLEELRRAVFDLLGIIRVYTKEPGKKPELTSPYVMKRGATVTDLAARVHKEILAHLIHARIWSQQPGVHAHVDGQMVNREHKLEDRDIVELHT